MLVLVPARAEWVRARGVGSGLGGCGSGAGTGLGRTSGPPSVGPGSIGMNASSEGRVTPYFYSPAASGVKIVICAPPPPGEEEFGRNAPKRLIVSQSCAEDIFGPKARMLAQCNNWWAVQDSNLRPPACKAGALTS